MILLISFLILVHELGHLLTALALGFKADLREYGTGAEILADLGVKKMILMTNNPLKIKGLDGFGLEVVGREPIEMTCNEKNEFYMYTNCLLYTSPSPRD